MTEHNTLRKIIDKFALKSLPTKIEPLGAGFINDTFLVTTSSRDESYILQRKNRIIFPHIPEMMANIVAITTHLRNEADKRGENPEATVLSVVLAHDGRPYALDENGEYWAVCRYINDSVTYERADTPELAYKGGRGIGQFQSRLADFTGNLFDTLPGFHDMRFRFEQWDKAIEEDIAERCTSLKKEIGAIESHRSQMLDFWRLVEEGVLPRRATHNDAKISNILFDRKGNVKCMIDLDTVMMSTSLNDFGDAIRSYANTGAEDDPNLENVSIDLAMFEAFTRGYLEERRETLTPLEIDKLAFSALYITYEQTLRFLMDYINGDTYYKTAYPQHNLVRARAQLRLLEDMEKNFNTMHNIVVKHAGG